MKSVKITLENETGLHARPASELSSLAMKYKCDIDMKVNDKTINVKSILGIMSAGIKQNTDIEIICDGEDEAEATEAILEQFKKINSQNN